MIGLPPLFVWKGLVGSTTAAWALLHLFVAVGTPTVSGRDVILFFLPTSVILVLLAASVSILDLYTNRERAFCANLGVGRLAVYGAAVVWLSALEALLGILVLVFGLGAAR